jgi:hypothetical protein
MEELKRMLRAIHEENKDIIFLLCADDKDIENYNTIENFLEISNEIDQRYDPIFYGGVG